MSVHQLYTVTVTDLGTYAINVAACDPGEAELIAKRIVLEEFTSGCEDVKVIKREAEAKAEADPAASGVATDYRVEAIYTVDFGMTVQAMSRAEAVRHARRLYEENCGPFEFDIEGDRVGDFRAEEVRS